MAQYGHNWYGTAYYGRTNAFSGWYETREILTEEPLGGPVNLELLTHLPSATYGPTAPEVQQVAGTWTYDAAFGKISSSSATAKLRLVASGEDVAIRYEQRTTAAKVTITVTSTNLNGEASTTTHTLNTQSTTVNANATFKLAGLPFGNHDIAITMAVDSPAGAAFHFKGFTLRTTDITVEARARLGNGSWTGYTETSLTTTLLAGSEYLVTALTPNYAGQDTLQLRVYLATSDNGTSPEVLHIQLSSGDSNNRTKDGMWSAVFNMEQIAVQAGATFQKVEEVAWLESVPTTTNLVIRSQSSTDNLNVWDPATVPYKQGINRVRLKEGKLSGWIDAPVNAPASKRPYVRTKEWDKWNDQSFLPPISSTISPSYNPSALDRGTSVIYDFLNTQKDNTLNPYQKLVDPMLHADRTLRGTDLRNLDNVLRIRLSRTSSSKQTPVVDFVHLTSFMRYEQDVATENQEFSAVDFQNTGKGVVLDMTTTVFREKFKVPAEVAAPEYELIDGTSRPQDLLLYLDSQKNEAIRNGKTNTLNNKVWAEARVQPSSSTTGLIKNYQYGGGEVTYPHTDEVRLAPQFTPSLQSSKKYRYYLQLGWPQEFHTVKAGEVLEDIATRYGKTAAAMAAANPRITYNNDGTMMEKQVLAVPNDTLNTNIDLKWKSTLSQQTAKSSHNAMLGGLVNVESDSIVAEVKSTSIEGLTEWVSEEKIYAGVLNLNDIRSPYKRSHITPDSGDSAQVAYETVTGDTYKKVAAIFGVSEEDVRWLNKAGAEDELTVGQRILVPSRIVLPRIIPQALVTDNPYVIDFVYNSVKKKDGKVLPTSILQAAPLSVTYKTVPREADIERGSIANGRDVLPDARVVSVERVESASGIIVYNEQVGAIGDFEVIGNHIDWATGTGVEPSPGSTYRVRYTAEVPDAVTVTISTDYEERGGVDRIWRSPEVKEFTGMCYPSKDYVAALPDFGEWVGVPDANVEDLQYIVEDNDIWVKTWVEQRGDNWVMVGSLQDRIPKDNWHPSVKTGYYYLGQDEYYLFNEPIVIEPTDREIPVAKNVEFVPGKFANAAQLQEGSVNLILNSGFDTASQKKPVFKLTF